MDEKCVCYINGFRLKDTEARRKATTAGEMANAAMEKAIGFEKQIAEAVTTANRAKTTADGAVVTAKAAYTTAKAAETTATAAQTAADGATLAAKVAENAANEKVSRKGDTMEGALDMGNHEIANVMNVQTRAVILREPGNGVDVTVEAMTEPGTVRFVCPKRGNRVIVRGVAPGVADTDAVNMAQVREMVKSVNGVEPDENGNVEIEAGGATDEQVEAAATAWLTRNAASLRGERGFSADYYFNPWPNPLEAYRDNSNALVVPVGTLAEVAELNPNTGVVTPKENYARTWTATVKAGVDIEICGGSYAFYDSEDVYISGESLNTTEWTTVTVPENAKFIRIFWSTLRTSNTEVRADFFQPAVYYKSAKQHGRYIPNPRSIVSKIYDPAYAHLNVVFSGDSNTYGAGLDDREKSWAGLIASKLQTIWGEGPFNNSTYTTLMPGNVKCKNSTQCVGGPGSATAGPIEFDFNGMELMFRPTFATENEPMSFDVYVDDELHANCTFTSATFQTLTFPDYTRKRLRFNPTHKSNALHLELKWPRTMEFTNVGLSGANFMTMPVDGIEDCDLFIYMLGTNQRSGLFNNNYELYGKLETLNKHKDKVIAILPPPRGYDETMPNGNDGQVSPTTAQWTSEAYINASIVEQYNRLGITFVDISAEIANESARHYKTMLQDDLLHFSEEGHKILANAISAKLGVPTYIKLEPVTA